MIPIVDYDAKDAPARLFKSIKDTGFGVLSNTFIKKELIDSVYEDWHKWFEQPLDKKMEFQFNQTAQDGYFPMHSEKAKDAKIADLKEFIHYYPNRKTHTISTTLAAQELCLELESLAMEVLEWLEERAPKEIPDKWNEMVDNSTSTLYRVLHYPPLSGDENKEAVRAAAHTDINFITMLCAATDSGLQVQDKSGNWINVGTDSNSIVVNIGDLLETMTKGFYKSTPHRVVNPEGESRSRYSMPLFLHPHANTMIDHETAETHLNRRLKELTLK